MSDLPRKVRPGQRLEFPASFFNALAEMLAWWKRGEHRKLGHPPATPNGITPFDPLAINKTGALLPVGSAAAIKRVVPESIGGGGAATYMPDWVLELEVPTLASVAIAVPLRHAEVDEAVRVRVAGLAVAKVNVISVADRFAVPIAGITFESHPVHGFPMIPARSEGAPAATGLQWCLVDLSRFAESKVLAKSPAGGIPAKAGSTPGTATCELYQIDAGGTYTQLVVNGTVATAAIANNDTSAVGANKDIQAAREPGTGRLVVDWEKC